MNGILVIFFGGKLMNNDKGNILISLVVIIMVLSVLSIAAYGISHAANREAKITRDNSQAYYIAKSGADLVISDIDNIINDIDEDNEKIYEINFLNEGKAIVQVKLVKEDNVLMKIEINSEGKANGSKNKISARLTGNKSSEGNVTILGVDENGNLYEFDEDFEEVSGSIISDELKYEFKNKINGSPSALAWNGSNKLVLVGEGSGRNKPDTAIYNLDTREVDYLYTGGNGKRYITYSGDINSFYAINTSNDKVLLLSNNEWENLHKITAGFKIQRLAQGNRTIVGISQQKKGKIAYISENINEWSEKNTNIYGTYNDIAYGNKRFVIIGSDGGHPLIIYSDDGVSWKNGEIKTLGTGFELYSITWTGEKFIAVGEANTIYSSPNGKEWYRYPREDITHIVGHEYYYDLKNISSSGNYIISYSKAGNSVLISDDGGANWKQKNDNTYPKLEEIIVINKGDGQPNFYNPNIQWSK